MDEQGNLVLQSRKDAFQVRFPKTSQTAKLVAIKKWRYGFSSSLVGSVAVNLVLNKVGEIITASSLGYFNSAMQEIVKQFLRGLNEYILN